MKRPDVLLIDIIAGARPNFMKIAPIIRALDSQRAGGGPLRYRLVHTGQHYDARMSGDFFTQLGIPAPDVNLEVSSGTQAEQDSAVLRLLERLELFLYRKAAAVVSVTNAFRDNPGAKRRYGAVLMERKAK